MGGVSLPPYPNVESSLHGSSKNKRTISYVFCPHSLIGPLSIGPPISRAFKAFFEEFLILLQFLIFLFGPFKLEAASLTQPLALGPLNPRAGRLLAPGAHMGVSENWL